MPTAHPDASLQQYCQVAGVVPWEADADLRRMTHISPQVESVLGNAVKSVSRRIYESKLDEMPALPQHRSEHLMTRDNRCLLSVLILGFLLAFLSSSEAFGQQSTPAGQSASPAWSPSMSIGVFTFARNGQSADQQLKDESECYGLAKQRTGIDPQAPAPAGKSAEQKAAEQKAAAESASGKKGGAVGGAARGAAGGAAIGAIAGDAGKGAAAGAVAGTMRGSMAQRQANAAAQKQAAAQAAAKQQKEEEQMKLAHAEGLDTFQRAFGACMDARGYSVK